MNTDYLSDTINLEFTILIVFGFCFLGFGFYLLGCILCINHHILLGQVAAPGRRFCCPHI